MNSIEIALTALKYQRAKIAKHGDRLYVPKDCQKIHRLALNETTKVMTRGHCEKCGNGTCFAVTVIDRMAYWCGCE